MNIKPVIFLYAVLFSACAVGNHAASMDINPDYSHNDNDAGSLAVFYSRNDLNIQKEIDSENSPIKK